MSTSQAARQAFQNLPEETRRAILEGQRIRVHAAKASVIHERGKTWIAIDTLPRDGHPDEWERVTNRVCRILKRETDRIPMKTRHLLGRLAAITPGHPLELFQVETLLSMSDDGGSWWEVPAYLTLLAISLPDVMKASERSAKKILKVVCAL